MKLEVKNEKYNRFLKRKELELIIEHPEEATPSNAALQQMISKHADSDAEKIEIKSVISSHGSPTSTCLVFVWDEKTIKNMPKEKKEEGEAKTPAQ